MASEKRELELIGFIVKALVAMWFLLVIGGSAAWMTGFKGLGQVLLGLAGSGGFLWLGKIGMGLVKRRRPK